MNIEITDARVLDKLSAAASESGMTITAYTASILRQCADLELLKPILHADHYGLMPHQPWGDTDGTADEPRQGD